jgi:formylmethanofuran dehydrogenase subunit C
MSALILTLREQLEHGIDVSLLSPERLTGLDTAAIGALPLCIGNRRQQLSSLFDISGDDAQQLVIANSSRHLHGIGSGMTSGNIRIEGDCGDHLGQDMRNGSILVTGNSGHWTACGMFDGMITPGNRQGMRGGTLLVRGNSGDRTGDHLRRGRILVEGNAGAWCGSRMIAGTIAVLGKVGPKPGYAMRRGTLLLWETPAELPVTLNDCGIHNLGFLPLLTKSFAALDSRFAEHDNGKRLNLRINQ